jgi:hypothetical protein
MSLNDYIQYLDWVEVNDINSTYQRGGNSMALRAKWAVQSFTHYYALSRFTPSAQRNEQTGGYYRDIPGNKSLIPDVVARGLSASAPFRGQSLGVGVWQLIDKYGQVYFSTEVGYGADLPSMYPTDYTYREGYVIPPSAGNEKVRIAKAIKYGNVSWETSQSTDPIGYDTAEGRDVWGPYEWGIQGWDFLDGKMNDAVAKTPDNGCDCGG